MAPGRHPKPIRPTLDDVESRLGYVFADKALLTRALTHSSAAQGGDHRQGSYQRLEFLGDRVLGLAVAEMLFSLDDKSDEGAMSRRLSELVRAETCAQVASSLDLGAAVRVGSSEAKTGVGKRAGVLADLCE
ncbi:MAG: ribonuclease III domain-containing protein, partial [Alphaproteobacteria bacterium]